MLLHWVKKKKKHNMKKVRAATLWACADVFYRQRAYRRFHKDGTDSPVADDDDDDHSDEENQTSSCRSNDERKLLLNAGVVFLYRKKENTHKHSAMHAHTHTHTHAESHAETYGQASEPLHTEGAVGDRQTYGWLNQWASWHLDWLRGPFSEAHWNVLRCRGYGQIIWQKVCEVRRESMFGWDPGPSGRQEQGSSYWMGELRQSQILLLRRRDRHMTSQF